MCKTLLITDRCSPCVTQLSLVRSERMETSGGPANCEAVPPTRRSVPHGQSTNQPQSAHQDTFLQADVTIPVTQQHTRPIASGRALQL